MPEGDDWTYLKENAESVEAATYRLKNMALLDYITEINEESRKNKMYRQRPFAYMSLRRGAVYIFVKVEAEARRGGIL